MKTKTIILLVSVPFFQFDHKVYRLSILDTFYTEKGLYINDTDAAKLDKMSRNVRCRTYQSYVTYFTKFYYIITDQSMPSLDQLQGSFAFTDTALSCDQNSFAINIYKHTMNGNTWSQLNAKPADNLCHQTGSGSLCNKCRHIVFDCHIDHIL